MSAAVPQLPVADRFALIIDGLCRAIAAQRITTLAAPLIMLLWNRLQRNAARFATLAARVQAGTLPPPPRPRDRHRDPGAQNRQPPRPQPRLPRAFGWLVRLVPGTAGYRSQLQHLLSDPGLDALVSAAPQTLRILRPLCHILAIRMPKRGFPSNPVAPEPLPSPIQSAPPGRPGPTGQPRATTPPGQPPSRLNPPFPWPIRPPKTA